MPSKSPQTLQSLLAQRDQLDGRIAAKKQSPATSVGTPFVTRPGDAFTPRNATVLADAIARHGQEKLLAAISGLS